MIINSILDLDLYKLSMSQVVYQRYPTAEVEYEFTCRDSGIDFSLYFNQIRYEINNLVAITARPEDLSYIEALGLFRADFRKYLKEFKFRPYEHIKMSLNGTNLVINIKGLWAETILYETMILAIVNEIYFLDKDMLEGQERLSYKINLIKEAGPGFKFADFGTRRRFSRGWQSVVLDTLKAKVPQNLVGTSNVMFAREFGLKPIGTMAHEYIMAHQAIVHPRYSQKEALRVWSDVYRGNLGIALTDTINMNAFLDTFDLLYAKLYDGLRHDSGDPYLWAEKAIKHYKKLGIDPKTKTLVFSDGLNFKDAIVLYKHFSGRINTSFGIGTNLMNDKGAAPLSIVIKMTSFNGMPVAKISDEPAKAMCKSQNFLGYLKEIHNIC